jgi:hypothetical protein
MLIRPSRARVRVAAGLVGLELLEDAAQRRLAEPPERFRGQREAVVAGAQVSLPLQLSLELAESPEVADRGAGQLSFEPVHVDVVQPASGEGRLRQLVLERFKVRQIRHRPDRVAEAQRLVAVDVGLLPASEHARPQRAQRVGELGHLHLETHVLHGLLHEPGQLLALLARERPQHPLGGGLAPRRARRSARRRPWGSPGRSRRACP